MGLVAHVLPSAVGSMLRLPWIRGSDRGHGRAVDTPGAGTKRVTKVLGQLVTARTWARRSGWGGSSAATPHFFRGDRAWTEMETASAPNATADRAWSCSRTAHPCQRDAQTLARQVIDLSCDSQRAGRDVRGALRATSLKSASRLELPFVRSGTRRASSWARSPCQLS